MTYIELCLKMSR